MKSTFTLQSLPELMELLNAIPHGVVLLDTDLCIVAMNRFLEAMTGFTAHEAVGVYGDFILRSNLSGNDQLCKKVLEDGQSVVRDGNIINKSRLIIPIHFTMSRIVKKGRPTGVLIVLEDMSALQAAKVDYLGSKARSEIIGHSHQMEAIFELMAVLARTDASVLITGETGTGKDQVAEQLHKSSSRARQPFVKVNCGALPEALLESELFGHVKGAFTGALNDHVGMFRLADKGTIFLTEIGDLSLQLQVKLLSVLDDQEFYPVGSSKKVSVNVRVIAATHRTLKEEVLRGRFREDLYYRLNVLHLHMPPLRERDGDVRLLLDYFLRHFSEALGKNFQGFSRKAIKLLTHYSYPGNVRELRNIVEYAVNICQQAQIDVEDLPQFVVKPPPQVPRQPAIHAQSLTSSIFPDSSAARSISSWAEVEKQKIMDTLKQTGGKRSEAAELLGWGRTTLWRKLKKYGLN